MTPEFDAVPIWDRARLHWERAVLGGFCASQISAAASPDYYIARKAREYARDAAYDAGCPVSCIRRVREQERMIWL